MVIYETGKTTEGLGHVYPGSPTLLSDNPGCVKAQDSIKRQSLIKNRYIMYSTSKSKS